MIPAGTAQVVQQKLLQQQVGTAAASLQIQTPLLTARPNRPQFPLQQSPQYSSIQPRARLAEGP